MSCINDNKGINGYSIIFDNKNGQYADNQLLKKSLIEHQITGLICANDIIALGAYKDIKELHLKIPDDVSVIGFDNIVDGELARPKLSTFNIAREELGAEVAHYLVNLFNGTQLSYSQITIHCKFIRNK